jgi:hypothetical protein
MQILPGVLACFDLQMVLHQDTQYFGWVRTELIDLTLRDGALNRVEVTIGGYDDDPRSLYEVPEVRRWVRQVQKEWPDAPFWLTPASLWLWMLCLNPQMFSRLPDGRLQIAMDTDQIIQQYQAVAISALELLLGRGLSDEAQAAVQQQAADNLHQTFERKKLGTDYGLVHPDTGQMVQYRRQA